MAPRTLLVRLIRALEWAHTQKRSFIARDNMVKLTLYCDGRDEVPGHQLLIMLVEAIEHDMPGNRGPCIVCKCDPCTCDLPF